MIMSEGTSRRTRGAREMGTVMTRKTMKVKTRNRSEG